ncbi:MAG: RnfABCDGE type electron transport complex subunit A [bacterium]
MNLVIIFFMSMIINNIVLIRFLALCSFLGLSNNIKTSIGMSVAVIFVLVLASAATWPIWHFVLKGKLAYLSTAAFILIIAALVQFVEMVIRKYMPPLYRAMGIYLPLITTNCAVFGIAVMQVEANYTFLESIVFAFAIGLGYTLSIILFAGLREKMDKAPIPKAFKGYPVSFIAAGLMSLAFLGFCGMFGWH